MIGPAGRAHLMDVGSEGCSPRRGSRWRWRLRPCSNMPQLRTACTRPKNASSSSCSAAASMGLLRARRHTGAGTGTGAGTEARAGVCARMCACCVCVGGVGQSRVGRLPVPPTLVEWQSCSKLKARWGAEVEGAIGVHPPGIPPPPGMRAHPPTLTHPPPGCGCGPHARNARKHMCASTQEGNNFLWHHMHSHGIVNGICMK